MHCKTAKEVAAVCVLVAGDKPRFTTVISGRTWLGAPVDITWAPNVARDAALTGGRMPSMEPAAKSLVAGNGGRVISTCQRPRARQPALLMTS